MPFDPTDNEQKPNIPHKSSDDEEDDKNKRKYPKGTVAWKQGFIWIIKVPPPKGGHEWSTEYSHKAPSSAPKHKRTPEETFHTRGGTPPSFMVHKMGALDVYVRPSADDSLVYKRSKMPAALKSKTPKFSSSGMIKTGGRRRRF